MERLVNGLQVDIEYTRRTLAWQPPVSADVELAATACWYRVQGRRT
jgi:hypothetical protein